MTSPHTILRESLLVLPLLAALGFAVAGVEGVLSVGLGGGLSVLNFAALAWALGSLMDGDAPVDPTGLIIVKTLGSLLALCGLMIVLDPIWVLVGANTVVLGILIRGTLDAFSTEGAGSALAEEA